MKSGFNLIAWCLALTMASACLPSSVYAQEAFHLVQNRQAACTIILPANADSLERLAARELSVYVQKITGAVLPVTNVPGAAAGGRVYIGKASPRYQELAGHSYNVVSTANSLHVAGSNSQQTLESVYVMLEQFAGCRFLTPTHEVVPSQPSLSISSQYHYTPFISTRTVHARLFYDFPSFASKRRVTQEAFPGFAPIARVHTFNRLLPASQWLTSHPEFYAYTNGRRQPTQLCLSNDTVYRMVRDSVAAWFKRYPASDVISVSQDDNTQYCRCERCAAVDAHEESPAGTMIHFVNRLAREFPNKTIATLAYQYTRKAPKHIRPEKNVLVTLCSIECDRSAAIDQKCRDFEADLIAWGKAGAHVQIWDYTTQFTNFLSPFPNLHTLQPNIQLFARNNARWIFEQHSHQRSELFELRAWLTAQLLWNPEANYDSLVQQFLQGTYGQAAPYIARYIAETENTIQQHPEFFLFLYGDPSQAFDTYLNEQRLLQYRQWFDEAETLAAKDTALLNRVRLARLGADYATLEYYRRNSGAFRLSDSAALQKLLNRFENTCRQNGVTMLNEMGLPVDEYLAAYKDLTRNASRQSLASGKPVQLLTKPKKYAGENPQALTDGVFGGWSFYANWLGFEGNDMEAVIDLQTSQPIGSVSVNFLQVVNHLV
ncbi:MAG: DUF4838 domain-containing protein, partial [Chitinophagaceae bacterium]|nr:DUF4838 domain-containing protein [Chitinophagaceae bacterium]